jgi:hypothetical protein
LAPLFPQSSIASEERRHVADAALIIPGERHSPAHLHVHVIPPYSGDVTDPPGGVRHVIPARANYLARTEAIAILPGLPHQQALIRGGDAPLLPYLMASLDRTRDADLAVAFVLQSGVRDIFEHLRDLLGRGGRLRLVTGDYLGVTEPDALHELALRFIRHRVFLAFILMQGRRRSFCSREYQRQGPGQSVDS